MRGTTLKQLRAFSAAARHLSFAKAAEELHLTPPAVTMQIKELESAVGLPLFDRAAKSVRLTMSGEYLLVYARRVLATLKDAENAMARLRGAEAGRIAIGMVSTAKYFLPRLLAKFHAGHRGVEMQLAVGNREQLVRQLHDNEVDLAVMGRPPRELDTRAEPFAVQPHAVVASPEHPLARLRGIPPSALGAEEFIVREPGSGTRAAMEQFFREQLDVVGLPLLRRWHIVNIGGKTLSPAAEALRAFVLEQGEALIAAQFAGGACAVAAGAQGSAAAAPPIIAPAAPLENPS